MKNTIAFGVALAAVLALRSLAVPARVVRADSAPELPEFTAVEPSLWVGSEPLSVEDLAGQVGLVHIWAFECWNCYRSFPWLNSLEKRLEDRPFQIIGIHTPEFEREKDRAALVRKIREFKLDHPVMMDNDYAYWNALDNRYWPAWYLFDRSGRIRAVFIGEIHVGDPTAKRLEAAVEALLAE